MFVSSNMVILLVYLCFACIFDIFADGLLCVNFASYNDL